MTDTARELRIIEFVALVSPTLLSVGMYCGSIGRMKTTGVNMRINHPEHWEPRTRISLMAALARKAT